MPPPHKKSKVQNKKISVHYVRLLSIRLAIIPIAVNYRPRVTVLRLSNNCRPFAAEVLWKWIEKGVREPTVVSLAATTARYIFYLYSGNNDLPHYVRHEEISVCTNCYLNTHARAPLKENHSHITMHLSFYRFYELGSS